MLTLFLQCAITLLQILFAAIAIDIARRSTSAPVLHRACWLLTGIAFFLGGVVSAVQNALGSRAFFAGPDSAAWATYLQVAPVMNHSRTGLEIALGCVLASLLIRASIDRRFTVLGSGMLVCGLLMGALIGMSEGELKPQVHYSMVALFDMVELFVLLAMLLVALLTRGMDWMLWVALTFHALTQAFNAISFSAFAWIWIPDVWSPQPWHTQFQLLLFAAMMLGLAWLRLSRVGSGFEVPALLEIGEAQTQLRSLE